MRKITKLLMLGMALCTCPMNMNAQLVQENEMAIVYYMPKRQLVIDITYTKTQEEVGPFCHFAEKYLGAQELIEADDIHYSVSKVQLRTRTLTDYSRPVKVVAENGIENQLLQINNKGLLVGYNIAPKAEENTKSNTPKQPKQENCGLPTLPLSEEQLKAKTLEQMAECAAKQIYRIRENRMYLLGGEIDHAPADGKAMQLVLEELDKQERELVELFTGRRIVTTHHKELTYTPTKSEKTVLYTLPDGSTKVELSLEAHRQIIGAAPAVTDKKAPKPSSIYYNLPGSAEIVISAAGNTFVEKTIPVPQFGVAVPLSKTLFTGKDLPHIEFDTTTGNILYITK